MALKSCGKRTTTSFRHIYVAVKERQDKENGHGK